MRLIHSYTEMDLKSNDSGSSWQGDSESSWLQDTEDSSVDSGARSISGGKKFNCTNILDSKSLFEETGDNLPTHTGSSAANTTIIEYPSDFTEFNTLPTILQQTLSQAIVHQITLTDSEAYNYLHCLLHLYAIVNLRRYRRQVGKPDASVRHIATFLKYCKIPCFFRDVFRELCRPCHHQKDLYIPYFDTLSTKLLKTFFDVVPLIRRINLACGELGLDVVPLQREILTSVPMAVIFEDRVLSSEPIPDFRIEALSALRFIKFRELGVDSFTDLENLNRDLMRVCSSLNFTHGMILLLEDEFHINNELVTEYIATFIQFPDELIKEIQFPTA
jgi:hypothetical protein